MINLKANIEGPKFPQFICIGAPKSGTSWLYDRLLAHPAIYITPSKGTNYFDKEYHRGPGWYSRHFRAAAHYAVCGEISHDYLSHPKAAERIAHDLPEVKLISILREPGDFVGSNIRWLLAHTDTYGKGVSGIWANPEIRANTRYIETLARYRNLFGSDQFLVLYYDDLLADPDEFLALIYDFIGVENLAISASRERVNKSRASRFPAIMRIVFSAARFARGMGLGGIVEHAKRSNGLAKILYRNAPVQISKDDQAMLEIIKRDVRAANAEDFEKIGMLSGRPVPARWREAAACL